jgi:hypothetical protein
LGLDHGMTRRHHRIDEAGCAGIIRADGPAHHQHREGALVSHHSRQQQTGSPLRDKAVLNKGGRKCRGRAGHNIIAVEHHGGADADGDAIDRRDDRLGVLDRRLQKNNGILRPRHIVCRGGRLQEIRDIVAGGEDAGSTGNDETADRGIGLRRIGCVAHGDVRPHRDCVRLIFIRDDDVLGHGISRIRRD